MLGLRAVTSVARIPSIKNAPLFFQCYNLTLEMADLFVTASHVNQNVAKHVDRAKDCRANCLIALGSAASKAASDITAPRSIGFVDLHLDVAEALH